MLLKEIIRTPEFGRLMEEVNNYKHPIALFGLSRTARAAFIAAMAEITGKATVSEHLPRHEISCIERTRFIDYAFS